MRWECTPYAAAPIALLWGLVIMGIDRWLVTSLPHDRTRKWLIATPRLILAILIGSLISTPIVLRIFESEINNQISVIKENNEASFLSSQQHSSVQGRITKWQNTVTNLEQVISSNGAQPINPANDPVVQGLTTQLNNERKVAAQDYHAWQCQLYGGCGAPKGSGPLAAGQQAALPGGREPDHDAHQRDQRPRADAAEQQRRGAADQAAAGEGRAAQRPGPARRGAGRGKLAARTTSRAPTPPRTGC